MAQVTIEIFDQALEAMNEPGGDIYRSTEEAAQRTVQRAKNNVTSAGRVRTGYLRDHIIDRPLSSSIDEVSFEIVSEADYSVFIHDGTRYISAVPFLTDALGQLTSDDYTG